MENNKTTLEEFQDFYAKVLQYKNWKNLCELCTKEEIVFNAKTKALLFAKHHRSKAIGAIDKKINEFYQEGNGMWPINEDLENAYPETEIK